MSSSDAVAGDSFDEVAARLDEIVDEVKAKDTSLERSLDLLDEAICLGNRAVELVDTPQPSEREKQVGKEAIQQ